MGRITISLALFLGIAILGVTLLQNPGWDLAPLAWPLLIGGLVVGVGISMSQESDLGTGPGG